MNAPFGLKSPRSQDFSGQLHHSGTPHLLIVDDHITELRLLIEIVRQQGYRISLAFDGAQAYQRAQALQPDLIIMDVQMPKLDGIGACRLLQNNTATSHIPIIFISAAGELDDRLEGFNSGAVDYVVKPYEPEEVLARITVNLKRKQPKRTIHEPHKPDTSGKAQPRDQTLVLAATEYLHANLRSFQGVTQLAKRFNTNEKRLSRAFRDILDCTVFEFVKEARLDQARRMLRETGLSITQIADELGYSNSANFATAFKSHFGLTPSQVRNGHPEP